MTTDYEELPFDTAPELVPEIVLNLGRSEDSELCVKATEFAERMFEEPGHSRSPRVLAASCVYFAGLMVNDKVIQRDVADAAGCAKASLRECYVEVAETHDIEVERSANNEPELDSSVVESIISRIGG